MPFGEIGRLAPFADHHEISIGFELTHSFHQIAVAELG